MFGNFNASQSSAEPIEDAKTNATTDFADWTAETPQEKALDLVFVRLNNILLAVIQLTYLYTQIMDATGSMGSYIASATKNIETICDNVSCMNSFCLEL